MQRHGFGHGRTRSSRGLHTAAPRSDSPSHALAERTQTPTTPEPPHRTTRTRLGRPARSQSQARCEPLEHAFSLYDPSCRWLLPASHPRIPSFSSRTPALPRAFCLRRASLLLNISASAGGTGRSAGGAQLSSRGSDRATRRQAPDGLRETHVSAPARSRFRRIAAAPQLPAAPHSSPQLSTALCLRCDHSQLQASPCVSCSSPLPSVCMCRTLQGAVMGWHGQRVDVRTGGCSGGGVGMAGRTPA